MQEAQLREAQARIVELVSEKENLREELAAQGEGAAPQVRPGDLSSNSKSELSR